MAIGPIIEAFYVQIYYGSLPTPLRHNSRTLRQYIRWNRSEAARMHQSSYIEPSS